MTAQPALNLRQRDYFSPSQLNLYSSCPFAYHRQYVRGDKPAPSDAAGEGIVCHEAARAYIAHLVERGLQTDITAARSIASETFYSKPRRPEVSLEAVVALVERFAESHIIDPDRVVQAE